MMHPKGSFVLMCVHACVRVCVVCVCVCARKCDWYVMSCTFKTHADEHDTAQKKTFTKWVNTHLMKVQELHSSRHVHFNLTSKTNLVPMYQ